MAPTLIHGWSLGPFDQLARLGLTATGSGTNLPKAHNPQVVDLIREIIPWTSLAWSQVHHGSLPLWNPYSALGGPLAFNWQSATFSLPALVGYLVPVRLDFTVQVLVSLVVGGTGVYVLARVMRLGVIGAALAATVFELSGTFTAVLGWPIGSVMSWAGWLFACAILILRGRHRRRYVVLFALIFAASIYAGEPDALIVLVVALIVFFAVVLGLRARRFGDVRAVTQPLVDVVLGSVAGLGLAAPLVLPAAQLTDGSIRGTGRVSGLSGLPDGAPDIRDVRRVVPDTAADLQQPRTRLRATGRLRRGHRRRARRRRHHQQPGPARGHRPQLRRAGHGCPRLPLAPRPLPQRAPRAG